MEPAAKGLAGAAKIRRDARYYGRDQNKLMLKEDIAYCSAAGVFNLPTFAVQ